MKDITKLRVLRKKVNDREKLDKVYKELLYPKMEVAASKGKKNEINIANNCNDHKVYDFMRNVFGEGETLQHLIETTMKPYLEEKGFKVVIWSPNYSVDVRW